jgi:type I restriction enzyme M protein
MNLSKNRISSADIAWLAGVKPAAVSNWRRRYEKTFPRPERHAGQEFYLANEIADWLDRRKIAKNYLRNNEPAGLTYGVRFRNNLGISSGAVVVTEGSLWQELERNCGAADVGLYADLVLGLIYLCARDSGRWADLVAVAESRHQRSGIGLLLERSMEIHETSIPHLRRAFPATLNESGAYERIAAAIRILDHHRRVSELANDRLAPNWAGHTFEYLLARFAAAEGKRGTEFFTPSSVVHVLVEATAPTPGDRIYDPCCDSGSFLVAASEFVAARGERRPDVSVSGQALMERSWRLAKMNLELHGLVADLGTNHGIALQEDRYAGRHFDVIMTNPPFNMSGWSIGDPAQDQRWRYGAPPEHNANYAWLQHTSFSLDEGGRAAVVMANGASTSENTRERAIRAAMVEAGVVEVLVALPPQLFLSTAIPVTIWLLRSPANNKDDEILFIDATALGRMINRNQRILTSGDVRQISSACEEWRDRRKTNSYKDVPGFSASVTLQKIREQDYRLNPRGYVARPVNVAASTATILGLRRTLDLLHARSLEVDAMVDRQLDRTEAWRP